MDLELWKKIKKEKKLTIADIALNANLPKGTVQNIFCGYIPNPRTDTVEAIEKALGISKEELPVIPQEKKELVDLILQLNEEGIKELKSILGYVLKK